LLKKEKGARANRYGVYSRFDGTRLGTVKWVEEWCAYGYYFFPEVDTLFSDGCLESIMSFIRKEMAKRR